MPTTQQIKEIILKELPAIIEDDPEIHRFLIQLSRRHFADKIQTEDRFDRIMEELRRDREADSQKWEEQNQKWKELHQTLRINQEEQNRKWDELHQTLRINQDEQNQKWAANQKVINEMLADIRALAKKHDSTIGALGARWGLHTERAFRNALKGILEKFTDVEVLNITEYDDAGVVFGRPDQIELDVIIKNGVLIIAEIKSSMSKPEMYTFEKKARFYEERHQRKATELIVISPMVAPNAVPVAERLGIKIYSSAEDVQL
jgi:hypothetical protein